MTGGSGPRARIAFPPRRKVAARLWNLLPLPFERMAARIEAPTVARASGADPPLNKICDRRDWEHPAWRRALQDLGYVPDPARLHRKEWEFAQGVYGLRKLRCLSPAATALGVGAGAAQRADIAVTIVGGQSLCLFLTLLLVPVAYSLAEEGLERGKLLWRARRTGVVETGA